MAANGAASAAASKLDGRLLGVSFVPRKETSMRIRFSLLALITFVVGVTVGYAARTSPSTYRSRSKKDAGKALLQEARRQAGRGSWERIAVGRVYYLAGMKSEGQAIFDEVLSKKAESSDYFRVARVYREAGEWPRAKELFDKYLALNPKDDKGLAEVGAYYLLNGEREHAEELFDRSFKLESEMWATVSAAAGYLGVEPQE
jgi:tetratricopeptide (TPR) repeat protein